MAKRALIYLLIFIFPWAIRRLLLQKIFKYQIHKKAYISRLSLILPMNLKMDENSFIGSFSIAIHLDTITLGESSRIGRSNWISGIPKNSKKHFTHVKERNPSLIVGRHSAITKEHIIDCTDTIKIGDFTTVAGFKSQLLTHSIDYINSRQDCAPINIGNYCIIGTNSVFLPASRLPNYSICGASSVINKKFDDEYFLYAGSPAKQRKDLNKDSKYFNRKIGYIN